MNRDEFAQAVFDRLPKECPGTSKREAIGELFRAVAGVIHDLPIEQVDETEAAMCRANKEEVERG